MIGSNGAIDHGLVNTRLTLNERIFKSRLGYDIELFDEEGDFNSVVTVPDDTGEVFLLYFDELKPIELDLKEHLKSFFIYLLPRYLPGSLLHYSKAIRLFALLLKNGLSPDMAIEKTLLGNPEQNTTVMKSLVRFLILNEYEGISFQKAEEILNLEGYTGNKNKYLSLFTLDEELGLFTREELRVLYNSLKNNNIFISDRLILALCLEFGLRPIQLSLLKESDFVEDVKLGISYLSIPRVKQGARYRRSEFSKRAVDEELASLIKQVIVHNREHYKELELISPPLFFRKTKNSNNMNSGSLLSGKYYRSDRIHHFAGEIKNDFAHHVAPQTFYHRFMMLLEYLPLSPRTGKPFHLTPYRFRYTVGTNAVIEGMTEEEVADLLDHSSTLCVKHYFRYTKEMWELLEDATTKRTEQQHFTAAWCRQDDLSDNIYGKEVIELHSFTAIGKCQKESACYLEPAIACYACNKFCPNKDKASHRNALTSLKERQNVIAQHSPTSLSKQLSEAIAGCEAAIAYSDGLAVVNIYPG